MSNLPLLPTDSADARFALGCAHREVNVRNPDYKDLPRRAPDDQLQMRMDEGIAYEEDIFAELSRLHKVVNNRQFESPEISTMSAMQRGDVIIIGPQLPTIHHRSGRPDILLRHGDAPLASGKWAYLPVDVKNSKALESKNKARQWPVSTLQSPWFNTSVLTGLGDGKAKEDHSLQLAHYWLMLSDLGHAPDIEPVGGILDIQQRIVWRPLDDDKKSMLAIAEQEWTTRWAAVVAMREGKERLTRPVYRAECTTCPWHDVCEDALIEEQHVSLVEGVVMDSVAKLAEFGIETIPHLASLDHALVGTSSLPDYKKLTENIDAARVYLHAGSTPFLRRGGSMPHIMRADIEIDFDVENDDVLYLLGNYITYRQADGSYTAGEYKSFHYFDRTDPDEEGRQLSAFWSWLHTLVHKAHDDGQTIAVYCYSGATAELARMKEASLRNSHVAGVPTVEEITQLGEQPWWVDLRNIVKQFHWPTRGMGLKDVAKLAGFAWDAADAGGGNSVVWYRTACDPLHPEALELQSKLLQYNADDVRATMYLRHWLTNGINADGWSIQPVELLSVS